MIIHTGPFLHGSASHDSCKPKHKAKFSQEFRPSTPEAFANLKYITYPFTLAEPMLEKTY